MSNKLNSSSLESDLYTVYQPKFYSDTLELYGFETLCRWSDPISGSVPPSVFIPIAERCGAIDRIGLLVLEKTIEFIASYNEQNDSQLITSVNVSPQQLHAKRAESFIAFLKSNLAKHKIDPKLIELEITETEEIDDITGIGGTIEQLKEIGVGLSIDDFGVGHSSIMRIIELDVDTIKLDKSIINKVLSEKGEKVCRGLIDTFQAIDMKVVAEGVENENQLKVLQEAGCDIIQGFHLGRPMNASAAQDLIIKSRE
ncbi:hypothetical protein VCHA53O466_40356 [Vibrio chagasii]|nr:hypothetical protein VCHA53O466_40356 [Vibrio chagasii]